MRSLSLEIGENGFDTPIDEKFLINMMQMGLHGIDGNAQLVCNFLVAPTGGRASQYLSFTVGQIGKLNVVVLMSVSYRARNSADEMFGCDRRQDVFSFHCGSEDAQEVRTISVLQDVAEGSRLHGCDDPAVFIIPGQQQHARRG